jgi:hypothetical protein
MFAKYMDFIRFICDNTLLYKSLLSFLEIDMPKLNRIKDRRKRFELLTQILEDRVA